MWIDESLEEFINDLSLYQYEWDDRLGEFSKKPKHDWTSHFADAYRYVATVYEHLSKDGETPYERLHPVDSPYFHYTEDDLEAILLDEDEERSKLAEIDENEDDPYNL